MKEKFIHIVVAVFLLILILIIKTSVFIPNDKQILAQNDNIIVKTQTNGIILFWKLRSADVKNGQSFLQNNYTSSSLIASSALCHRLEIPVEILINTPITRCDDDVSFTASRNKFNHKYTNLLRLRYKVGKFPSEVLTFMIAITFIKFAIVVIAYQQLLHNGYVILQNLYHKQIRQLELIICNRPYQLKSGHGLDDEENYLEQQYRPQRKHSTNSQRHQQHQAQGKRQILKHVNNIIEHIVTTTGKFKVNNIETQQYSSIQKEQKDLTKLNILNISNNQQFYHQQQQQTNNHYVQQYDCRPYHHIKNHQNNHSYQYYYYYQNNHSFYQNNLPCYQRVCHQVQQKITNEDYQYENNPSIYSVQRQMSTVPSKKSKASKPGFKSKLARLYNDDRSVNILASQPAAHLITSLDPLSSTICCWKTSSSRKHRKRKTNFAWDKSYTNYNYLIWRRLCTYRYCCCNIFCDIFSQYKDYFHIHCDNCSLFSFYCCCCCCICETNQSNISFSQTTAINYNFYKNKLNSNNKSSLQKENRHQINIISITKDVRSSSTQQSNGKWCVESSHSDDSSSSINRNNLIRSVSTVKTITSAVQNRYYYKRKLKKNLVWLFIGLVWLEGPKLINCSISHNNNDVTGISGNETNNKIGGSESSNSDNSSGNSGNGGSGRNSGNRNNGGSSSNTNGPGQNPRQDATESKEQNVKRDNIFKITNSLSQSGSNNIENYSKNRFMQNTILIEHPIQSKKYQYQTFQQRDRSQQRIPYIVSKTELNSNRPTKSSSSHPSSSSSSSLFESKEANRAQSDLVRLESIKRQILTKLGLTEKPNVTHPLPKQFIWDTIYRADGIRSVSDFDFNGNHRTQEHIRLTATVLEPPPLIPYPTIVNSITDIEEMRTDRLKIRNGISVNHSGTGNDFSSSKDMLNTNWKLLNLTNGQAYQREEQILSKYQRRHGQQQQQQQQQKQQEQQQQKLRSIKNTNGQNKNWFADLDYIEGDDFFGSTQEIITFAEKGKIYKKHRLVEFSPPSNKIPKQKLQIRNAEIHIRIEKVSTRSSITTGQVKHRHLHRHKYTTPTEPNLKIWIFQLIGNDFSSKGFDQVATLCTSLSVDHKVLGWQKLDITETVQFWYGKNQKDKLRLLIDCTGCGSRYILHLFDRNFHHSLLPVSPTALRQPHNEIRESNNKNNNTDFKDEDSTKNQSQRYYYHYRQHKHHRYKRKNRANPTQYTSKSFNSSEIKHQEELKQQTTGRYSSSLWLTNRKYRKSRETRDPNSSQEGLEGISYEVGAEYHLEDRLNPNRPFLVLHTEPTRSRRVRRRAVDCSGAMHGQCCKESFYVSFKALGWDDWIIAPRGYFANYCRGDCTGPYRTPDTFQTFHAHFIEEYRKMGLLNGMQPCCAPVKFSSMSLIYYGDDGIIKRDLPKMVVDECGCP